MSIKQQVIEQAQHRLAAAIGKRQSPFGPEITQILADLYDQAIGIS